MSEILPPQRDAEHVEHSGQFSQVVTQQMPWSLDEDRRRFALQLATQAASVPGSRWVAGGVVRVADTFEAYLANGTVPR